VVNFLEKTTQPNWNFVATFLKDPTFSFFATLVGCIAKYRANETLSCSVIINGVDYLGLLFSVLYYILALKKYHNFNGKMNKDQRGVAFVFLFIKLLFSFVIAFGWVFTRLDAKAIKKYPMYLTISDNFHLITWVRICILRWFCVILVG
jgi:hypothetical protein